MVSSKQRIPALAFCPISQGRNVHFRTGMYSHGHSREVSGVVVEWNSIVVRLLRSNKSKILIRWRRAFLLHDASNGHTSSRGKDWQLKCFRSNDGLAILFSK